MTGTVFVMFEGDAINISMVQTVYEDDGRVVFDFGHEDTSEYEFKDRPEALQKIAQFVSDASLTAGVPQRKGEPCT